MILSNSWLLLKKRFRSLIRRDYSRVNYSSDTIFIMTWFIWICISILTISAANIFQRVLMKEHDTDPYSTTTFFQFSLALLVSIIAFANGFVFPPLLLYPLNFFLGAILWAGFSYASFKSYQFMESSEIAILSSIGTLTTIISAFLVLHETISIQKIIGIILILFSVYSIQNKKKGKQNLKGVAYAVTATLLA